MTATPNDPTSPSLSKQFHTRGEAHSYHVAVIVWLNGTHGVGKTTTAVLAQQLISNSRVFDAEKVGETLMDASPGLPATDNFQNWPPWRPLVVETARRILDYTGGTLIMPMTVLVEDHLPGIGVAGLRIVVMTRIPKEGSLVDVIDDRCFSVVVAPGAGRVSCRCLSVVVVLTVRRVGAEPLGEQGMPMRFQGSRVPDVQVRVRPGEGQMPVHIAGHVVTKDEAKAGCLQLRQVAGLVVDVGDGEIYVDHRLGLEPGNQRRADVTDGEHLGANRRGDDVLHGSKVIAPRRFVLLDGARFGLSGSDPLALTG